MDKQTLLDNTVDLIQASKELGVIGMEKPTKTTGN